MTDCKTDLLKLHLKNDVRSSGKLQEALYSRPHLVYRAWIGLLDGDVAQTPDDQAEEWIRPSVAHVHNMRHPLMQQPVF